METFCQSNCQEDSMRDFLLTSIGEVSEIWNHFFKFNFFYVIFFAETSLGYLVTSPGSVGMVS